MSISFKQILEQEIANYEKFTKQIEETIKKNHESRRKSMYAFFANAKEEMEVECEHLMRDLYTERDERVTRLNNMINEIEAKKAYK